MEFKVVFAMLDRWDIAVYNRDDQLALVVEVKNRLNTSPEWAARLRRNILAHGTFPKAPYFLLAFPDRFYLWTDTDGQFEVTDPNYTIDARPLLQPYFQQMGVTAAEVSSQSLEFIVSSWLGNIVHSGDLNNHAEPLPNWLAESGLQQAVAHGSLNYEVVA